MSDSTQSEYIAARQEWDDRFAGQRKTVKYLSAITAVSLLTGLVGLSFGAWTGARTQYVPYIIQVDELGRTEKAADPIRVGNWPKAVVKRELELFFERLRTVSPDLSIIVENHNAIRQFLPTGSPAVQKITTYFNDVDNNPIKKAARVTISVDVLNINAVSDKTWRIEWKEDVYARQSGRLQDSKRFVATAQIDFRNPKTRELIKINPLGMFVTDIDVQEVRG